MIDLEEINKEIHKLETCDCTTYNICEKLAILYTVRDHYSKPISNTSMTKNSSPLNISNSAT